MTDPQLQTDQLTGLIHSAQVAANAPVTDALHEAGRQRVLAAALLVRRGERRAIPQPMLLATLAAAAVMLIVGSAGWFAWERPLTYEIHGGQQLAANYVDAAATSSPASVEFSDGSQIAAAAGSRLRIDATQVHGARVFLEHGSATAHVTHRKRSSWVFVAGPFDVHITGTRFTLAWDPDSQTVDLTLHEGSVEVDSPLGSSHCVVHAGQRFHASLTTGKMQLENSDSPQARNAVGPAKTTLEAPHPASKAPSKAATAWAAKHATAETKSVEAARDVAWPELMRHGDFHAVVEAANARGIATILASGNADDIRALADAARYTGHIELAEQSLTVLRTRFADSRQSRAVAFLLGRTYEQSARPRAADREYTDYLDKMPQGEFAAEALAGHMRMVAALQSPKAAKPIALEYLRRYRDGVHAEMARRLANGN